MINQLVLSNILEKEKGAFAFGVATSDDEHTTTRSVLGNGWKGHGAL